MSQNTLTEKCDILILGAGLAGLSAASVLGDKAIVIERNDRPGGLVRTECFNEYWFDHVLHILYFQDKKTEDRIKELLGDDLASCPPEAWVETTFGTVKFPFQMHIGGLEQTAAVRCLYDLAKVTFSPRYDAPTNFEEALLQTFGEGICETFLFPYNRKVWKRPLNTLAPTGFQWTITQPDFERVLSGAVTQNYKFSAYNADGWYPRPHKHAPVRGMEILTRALANKVSDIRLRHEVESIDLDSRTLSVKYGDQNIDFTFEHGCISTLPLPMLLKMCKLPEQIEESCSKLTFNRVLSAMFSIRGNRPEGRGHWRYYSDESVVFTRLVYMHEFDPYSAPEDGWGLMVEITEQAEQPLQDKQELLLRIRHDLGRVGALPADCEIIDEQLFVVNPAYVVFTTENQPIIEQARSFLKESGITTLGRYGKWEYSSMAQVMRDGFACGEEMIEQQLQAVQLSACISEKQEFLSNLTPINS